MVVPDGITAPPTAGVRQRAPVPVPAGLDSRRIRIDCLFLAGLAAIVGSVVAWYGGASRPQFDVSLAALGLFAIAFWCLRPAEIRAPALPWVWRVPLAGIPLLVAFQLIPLPIELLGVISPARAALSAAATPVLGEVRYAPLSVEPGTTFAHLVRVLSYLTVFLLVRELGWSLRPRRWLLALPLIVIAVAEACLAISQWSAARGQIQASGSYVNPNHLAGLLELTAPLGLAVVVAAWRSGKRARRTRWRDLAAASAMAAVALIAVGVVVSVSRMGWLSATVGVCASAAMLLGLHRGEIRWTMPAKATAALLAVGMLAVSVYLPPDKLIRRFGYLHAGGGIAAHSRLPLWRDTLQLVGEYPILGCGLGAFAAPFLEHKLSEPMLFDQYAHNDYLQVLAEMGIAGLVLLLWTLAAALRACWDRRPRPPIDRALLAGSFGAFAAIALHSLTDFNLYIPANAMVVAWIGGIAASIQDTSVPGAEPHATRAISRLNLYLPLRWAGRR